MARGVKPDRWLEVASAQRRRNGMHVFERFALRVHRQGRAPRPHLIGECMRERETAVAQERVGDDLRDCRTGKRVRSARNFQVWGDTLRGSTPARTLSVAGQSKDRGSAARYLIDLCTKICDGSK